MSKSILRADKSYTFSDYFEFAYPTKDIVAEFDYHFKLQKLDLPRFSVPHGALDRLRTNFYKKLPHISLTSEAAKREFLVAPLLFELLDYLEVEIDVEYPLNVNNRLSGNIDYLIRSVHHLIVVEAKKADLDKGFSQLAVELIAWDAYSAPQDGGSEVLYGAITVGDIWQFGLLERSHKLLLKDIDAFRVPADLSELFSVLLGILGPPNTLRMNGDGA